MLLLLVGYLAPVAPAAVAPEPAPSVGPISWLTGRTRRWLTGANAPVKVGVVLSIIGAGLLLTEAAGRDLLESAITTRLVVVAAAALLLLAIGWGRRRARPAFGLSLQGGGIAVLHVAVYASFPVHKVVPAVAAGAAVVAVTAAAVVLSVAQDSRPLAILGTIGGFLAPVLAYTSPDDHALVFGFSAVLSAAIVVVAWFKAWPELNLLGLASTFAIAAYWLWERFDPRDWPSVQPSIAVLVLLYLAIPVVSARPGAPAVKEMWTHPLVFGTPFMALGIQQLLVGHTEYGLAISAVALAVVHGGLVAATRLLGERHRELTATYAGLATVFIAIAVPAALNASYTATVWAAQGALLVWVGCRRARPLTIVGGGVLQALAGAVFAVRLAETLPYGPDVPVIANEFFLAAALLGVAGLVSGWRLHLAADRVGIDAAIGWLAMAWGTVWWLAGGLTEIGYQLSSERLSASFAFVVVSLGAAVLSSGRLRWPHLSVLGLLILPTMAAALGVSLAVQAHPLDRFGWAAWPVSIAVFYACLRRREQALAPLAAWLHAQRFGARTEASSTSGATAPGVWLHVVGFWLLAVVIGVEVHWQTDQAADGVWPLAATLGAELLLAAAVLWGGRRLSWPLVVHRRGYLTACAGPVLVLLAIVVLAASVFSDGDPEPVLYLPLLNPLALLVAAVLTVGWAWRGPAAAEGDHALRSLAEAPWTPFLAAVGTVLVTMEAARTVHHWRDVPWDLEALASSTTLQASLSVIWAVIGLSGMVAGVRLVRRPVWVAGASFMAVVVAKLFLVDLANLGAVSRVVSFLGVGVLLLIVGYLAPVPPASPDEAHED